MDYQTYRLFVLGLANPQQLNNIDSKLTNSALGMAGEAGEFADLVKKWKHQGHKLNTERLKEELGDILWYASFAASALETDFETLFEENYTKLTKRYPGGFTANDSINRDRHTEMGRIGIGAKSDC